MEFKKNEDGSYESQLITRKDYIKGLEDVIQLIHGFEGVKINALAAVIEGNSHDESWVRVYHVFEPGLWSNFLDAESKRKESLYVDTPVVRMNQSFEPALISYWANYCYDNRWRKVYIEYNGIAKIINIQFYPKAYNPIRYTFTISVETVPEEQMEDFVQNFHPSVLSI